MSIKIGSNIESIKAQRRLGEATSSLSKIFERLSSGQRINSASDDAAGLSIADDLNAKSRIFTQAIRNGNDGISLLNIADSAVNNLEGIVTRLQELTEQSANGSYSNTQRNAIDAEAQALAKEYARIGTTTSFNGIRIFDGSLGAGLNLQLGIGQEAVVNTSVGGAIGTGSFNSTTSYVTETNFTSFSQDVTLGDLNGDGVLDLVTTGGVGGSYATVRLGSGDGSFNTATSYSTGVTSAFAVSLGDLNNDGILDLVTAGQFGSGGYAQVRMGRGDGSFGDLNAFLMENGDWGSSNSISLGDVDGDGILDLVTAGYSYSGSSYYVGYATIRLGKGNGSFGAARSFVTEDGAGNAKSNSVSLSDLNGDGKLDLVTTGYAQISMQVTGFTTVRLGNGNGTFSSATSYTTGSSKSALGDLNGDGNLDLVSVGGGAAGGFAQVRLGMGNGSFGSATSFSAESNSSNDLSLTDLNGDGFLDLITNGNSVTNGYATIRLGQGNGSFGSATSYLQESSRSLGVALGDLNADGILDLVTAGRETSGNGRATVRLGAFQSGLAPILSFSLKTKAESLQAMGMLKNVQNNLLKQRGIIGANQNRANIAIDNLTVSRENFSAAEARIRDVDIASDSSNLVRLRILQQSTASVLAQANQTPSLALVLLKA